MKPCIAVLALLIAVCCAPGQAQSVTPSITIGTHTLTLGMPESTVLEQVGDDLTLQHLPSGSKQGADFSTPDSAWIVEKKTGNQFVLLGGVSFTAHKLSSVSKNWEIQQTSSKSLFYAISAASKSLEQEGFTSCQLSTNDETYQLNNGSLTTNTVRIDCGMKGILIESHLTDAPDVDSNLDVMEWLRQK